MSIKQNQEGLPNVGDVWEINTTGSEWKLSRCVGHDKLGGVDCAVMVYDGGYHAMSTKTVRPPPEAKPYTFETFPRGVVYLQIGSEEHLVLSIRKNSVMTFNGFFNFDELHYSKVSTDLGKTWRKCEDNGSDKV